MLLRVTIVSCVVRKAFFKQYSIHLLQLRDHDRRRVSNEEIVRRWGNYSSKPKNSAALAFSPSWHRRLSVTFNRSKPNSVCGMKQLAEIWLPDQADSAYIISVICKTFRRVSQTQTDFEINRFTDRSAHCSVTLGGSNSSDFSLRRRFSSHHE